MKIFGPLYNRAITWSRHRYAPALLTGLSFVEGFIFPVPPEVMLGPMSLANRHQALWFATLSLLGSLAGALLGYLLGHFAFAVMQPLIAWLGWSQAIDKQIHQLQQLVLESPWRAFWLLVLVGFTPIPLKIFTWASGIVGVPLLPFLSSMLIGRGKRVYCSRWRNQTWRQTRRNPTRIDGLNPWLDHQRASDRSGWLGYLENQIWIMERSMEISKLLLSTALALALTACSTATTVRPNNTSNPRTTAKPNQTVVVKQGDTLYAISRRTGVAPQDLAAWNRLTASKTIYPGQVLRLYPEDATASPTPTQPVTSRPTPSNPSPTTTTTAPANSGFNWFWPTEGAVVSNFVAGQTTKQGVSINGNNGQTIRAAANGTVVYSGSALIGYGELIIIKHNEQWISAYGHNRKRLVNEGQTVKANQPIAEMGRVLYFEIRYNGKPVDPLVYLPKK